MDAMRPVLFSRDGEYFQMQGGSRIGGVELPCFLRIKTFTIFFI